MADRGSRQGSRPMTRFLPLILAAAVYALGNALADGDWLSAFPLGVIVGVGVVKLGWSSTGSGECSKSLPVDCRAIASGTVATRLPPEPASRFGPDGRVSTIAVQR